METLQHLFLQSEGAREVWNYFAKWFPKGPQQLNVNETFVSRFKIWGAANSQVARTHFKCLLPGLILWFIWTERNDCIFKGIIFQSRNVVWRVINQLHWLRKSKTIGWADWVGCKPQVAGWGQCRKRFRIFRSSMVKWEPPDRGWLKLNVDGAFHADTGRAGGGGIIRDPYGKIVKAFCCPLIVTSAWEAELLAVHQGVLMAADLNCPVWVELDAESVVNLINNGEFGPARSRHTVNSLRIKIRNGIYKVTHICREGNKAADFLARKGAQGAGMEVFNEVSAPATLKALADLDRLGLPNFRFRAEWE